MDEFQREILRRIRKWLTLKLKNLKVSGLSFICSLQIQKV